ncbi:nucleotide exchange factor GrpE [Novipirellula caenicola]|uniref:Protein GrpE n=1 Tax=Novipirellula caenicola TaxID=1536901 RepID=A0ABP9VU39_9BACT
MNHSNLPLRERLAASEDQLARTTAEFHDYRHRSRNELNEEKKYSGIHLMHDLLPVLDNLDRAILSGQHSGDFDALMESVELVRDQFYDALSKHGLREVSGSWSPFDPKQHRVIGQKDSDKHPDGSVLEVVEQGYRLHDRVIRPSKVIVSRSDSPTQGENPVNDYIIVETDDGYTIAGVPNGSTAESAAMDAGGVLIDDVRYKTFDEAQDVLMALPSPYPERAND